MIFLNDSDLRYLQPFFATIWRVAVNAVTAVVVLGYLFVVGMMEVVWLAIMAVRGCGLSERGQHCAWFTYHWLGKPIFAICGIRIGYQNAGVLVRNEPYVVVANHASAIDVVALLVVPDFIFVSKDGVKWWPPIGWMGLLCGQIFIRREDKGNLSRTWDALLKRQNANLLVFAEATRSRDGRLGDFKTGAAKTATHFERAIIPATIRGTYGLLGRSVWHFLTTYRRGQSVEVVFDNPVQSTGYAELTTEKVRRIIALRLGQEED